MRGATSRDIVLYTGNRGACRKKNVGGGGGEGLVMRWVRLWRNRGAVEVVVATRIQRKKEVGAYYDLNWRCQNCSMRIKVIGKKNSQQIKSKNKLLPLSL